MILSEYTPLVIFFILIYCLYISGRVTPSYDWKTESNWPQVCFCLNSRAFYIFTGVDRWETPSYKGHSNKLYKILWLPSTYAQFHNIYPIPDHKFVLIMGKEDDENIQANDEEKLLDKVSKKPEPTSVQKTDRGSALIKESRVLLQQSLIKWKRSRLSLPIR